VTPTPSIRIVELPSPEQNAAADGDRATGVTTMATTSHGRFQIELTVRPVEDMEAGTGAFVNEMSGQLRLLNEMAAQVTSLGHENTRWTEVTGQIVSTHTGRETGREVLSTGGTTEAPAIAVPATAGSGAVDAQQQQRQTAMTTTPQVPQTQAYIQIPTVTVQQGYYVPAPIVPFSVHYYGSQDMAVGAVNYEMQALGIPVSSPGMIYY
jgi:hypothetical protein